MTSRYNRRYLYSLSWYMKRTISLTITSLLIGLLVVYTVYLMIQWAIYPTPDLSDKGMIIGVWLILLLLAVWWYATLGAHRLSKPKITLSLLWLIVLLYGAYLVTDPANSNTFLSDFSRIMGVYIFIAALAWFIWPIEWWPRVWWAPHRIKDAEIIEI